MRKNVNLKFQKSSTTRIIIMTYDVSIIRVFYYLLYSFTDLNVMIDIW